MNPGAIKNLFSKHSQFWISLLIFTLVFVLLGLPFVNWGFMNDDFGLIFHSKIKSLWEVLGFFTEGNAGNFLHPSNYVPAEKSFFTVYYRPVAFVLHTIATSIFGFSPYGHYLFFMFFHAINSVLVFNFFCLFFSINLACWGAMFFAFHPSLCSWLGWISALQQVVNFTFIISIAILFKKFLDSKRPFYYICSLILFLFALFTRETVVFFPAVLFLWAFVSEKYCVCSVGLISESNNLNLSARPELVEGSTSGEPSPLGRRVAFQTRFVLFYKSCLIVSGFVFIDLFYFLFRLYHFPFKFNSTEASVIPRFFANLSSRFFDLVTFLSDLAGLAFLPNGHRMLKGFLIVCIFSFLIYLFMKCKEKRLILFLIVISAILMWPAICRYYSSRYLYKALPLVAFAFMIFIKNFCRSTCPPQVDCHPVVSVGPLCHPELDSGSMDCKFKTKQIMPFAWGLVLFNMLFLFIVMKNNEALYHKIHVAFDELCADAQVKERALCFVGIPYGFFPTGAAQAVWMRGVSTDHPIYYDRSTFGFSHLPVYENCLKVIPTQNGFKIISTDRGKLDLCCSGVGPGSELGEYTIIADDKNYVEKDFVFYKHYADRNPLLITWDYEKLKFIVLD